MHKRGSVLCVKENNQYVDCRIKNYCKAKKVVYSDDALKLYAWERRMKRMLLCDERVAGFVNLQASVSQICIIVVGGRSLFSPWVFHDSKNTPQYSTPGTYSTYWDIEPCIYTIGLTLCLLWTNPTAAMNG
jgi:hypothetical protein